AEQERGECAAHPVDAACDEQAGCRQGGEQAGPYHRDCAQTVLGEQGRERCAERERAHSRTSRRRIANVPITSSTAATPTTVRPPPVVSSRWTPRGSASASNASAPSGSSGTTIAE